RNSSTRQCQSPGSKQGKCGFPDHVVTSTSCGGAALQQRPDRQPVATRLRSSNSGVDHGGAGNTMEDAMDQKDRNQQQSPQDRNQQQRERQQRQQKQRQKHHPKEQPPSQPPAQQPNQQMDE